MPDQITTVAELEALPVRTILADSGGHPVWRDRVQGWRAANGTEDIDPDLAIRDGAPLTVLYRPDAPSLGADDQAGGPLKGAPKPSAEAVADALIQYETGGMCHFGQTCGLCDCGRADETPEQTQTRDAMELDRARAVLALIPPQRCAPSEDEVAAAIEGADWPEQPGESGFTIFPCDRGVSTGLNRGWHDFAVSEGGVVCRLCGGRPPRPTTTEIIAGER